MENTTSQVDWDKAHRRLRQLGLRSWDQVAKQAGIQRQHLYALRSGRTQDPRLSTIRSLADVLQLSIDELLSA